MAREIRAPEQVTGDLDRMDLLYHAWALAVIMARNTRHNERHVAECIMRVVGYLCATGGDGNA